MYLNKVTLMGYLAKDADHRVTQEAVPYTVLSLVTKRSWKDRSGDWQSRAEWHRCIVWGEQFATFAATLKRGAHLQLEGELRSREYRKDGQTVRVVEVRADSILKLDSAHRQTEAIPQGTEPSDTPL